MSFRGIRDFRTEDPQRLRGDLQRWNQLAEEAFGALPREFMTRWSVVKVTTSVYQARHGDLVLAGYAGIASIVLPRSSSETAGLSVRVVQAAGTVTVFAPTSQAVNGTTSAAVGSTGFREFTDDGFGAWWGAL